ncbi:MAG: undecaprenyldiphospho-muramoylpentapeptide beta-N-acetylglucosaminyltransferase [Gammaproteobacteria bacterium]|jgi:UDP-N-acetylglucosamine--N-acetylmuramyl-(pentapeptide) pyrophosphoryl-undecaprenol N-acetylglucosamine transferase
MSKIIFTGGGSAGHVTPNLALMKKLSSEKWEVFYVGSKSGQESSIIAHLKPKVQYFAISTGKLRRYFSWRNFIDPFKIIFGILGAWRICGQVKPSIVFSKGSFVAFPVVVAAWVRHIPVIIHESDFSPGLANRLSFPFASKICTSFAESAKYFSDKYKKKLVYTGLPIRSELLLGDAKLGREFCGFDLKKKIILVQGGGLGADSVNKLVREILPKLLPDFQIVHSCGKDKVDENLKNQKGYVQFEYINEEMPHILAAADLVVSRAGSNSVYELVALKKPHILLPLSKESSRGDQILNAKHFEALGLSSAIYPEDQTSDNLYRQIEFLAQNLDEAKQKFADYTMLDSVAIISALLKDSANIGI